MSGSEPELTPEEYQKRLNEESAQGQSEPGSTSDATSTSQYDPTLYSPSQYDSSPQYDSGQYGASTQYPGTAYQSGPASPSSRSDQPYPSSADYQTTQASQNDLAGDYTRDQGYARARVQGMDNPYVTHRSETNTDTYVTTTKPPRLKYWITTALYLLTAASVIYALVKFVVFVGSGDENGSDSTKLNTMKRDAEVAMNTYTIPPEWTPLGGQVLDTRGDNSVQAKYSQEYAVPVGFGFPQLVEWFKSQSVVASDLYTASCTVKLGDSGARCDVSIYARDANGDTDFDKLTTTLSAQLAPKSIEGQSTLEVSAALSE